MKKSNKKEVANLSDLVKDWNENSEYFNSAVEGMTFNDFLAYCIERFTILPK